MGLKKYRLRRRVFREQNQTGADLRGAGVGHRPQRWSCGGPRAGSRPSQSRCRSGSRGGSGPVEEPHHRGSDQLQGQRLSNHRHGPRGKACSDSLKLADLRHVWRSTTCHSFPTFKNEINPDINSIQFRSLYSSPRGNLKGAHDSSLKTQDTHKQPHTI